MRLFSSKNRAVHLGDYPLERLPRQNRAIDLSLIAPPPSLALPAAKNRASLVNAMSPYLNIMDRMRLGDAAPQQAPLPDSRKARSKHLKAACYYLDASMVGVCPISDGLWLKQPRVNTSLAAESAQAYGVGAADNPMAAASVAEGQAAWGRSEAETVRPVNHRFALVIACAFPREPGNDEPGCDWLQNSQAERAALRAGEVGAVMVNYLRMLGFEARLHTVTAAELNINGALVAAGLAEANVEGVTMPFIGDQFGAVAVSTTLELSPDLPLADGAIGAAAGLGWWLGWGGTRAGWQGPDFAKRQFHQGLFPTERLKRVEDPTTFIDAARVPRVPKRHDMFIRGSIGDLGDKAQRELEGFRMITKSPFGHAMIPVLGGMVPLQYGEAATDPAAGYDDPEENSRRIKAAMHYLGADMVGICEIPDYAWYSHDVDGSEITPYHKYAICILIDQGYDTMEGASGDDWISGAQSMRAYMRAQLIGGVVGSHLRDLGFSARGHSVMDQDVLHIPLNLLAGLGELPRIGEMVLNPFVGPRFKSGILTTNLPLAVDKPIDFGMQDFCNKCQKCARECPCLAIPFGDKIMFNGYEIWKPDVEKCSRYRITNAAGSMCGRCMKTCPYNLEGVMKERPFLWSAMHIPFTRKWLAKLDDVVGNGRINPIKKWWWDHDTDETGRIIEAARVNRRELNFRNDTPSQDRIACYPIDTVPDPINITPTSPDRKQGMLAYQDAMSPDQYQQRLRHGTVEAPVRPAWYNAAEGENHD